MTDPAIPLNQQDAFPLQSIAAAQQATDVQVIGGMVTKYFGPSATGVFAAAVTTDANGHRFCASNYLDMMGCNVGAALISRNDTAAAPLAAPAFQLLMQYRATPITVMPTSNALGGGSINLDQCGMIGIHTTLFTFAASTAPITEYALISWGPSTDAGTGAVPSPVSVFADVRFFISFGTNTPAATNRFSLSIWGSS
jgi:hypothetical protein